MTAASFVAFFFWTAVLFGICAVGAAWCEWQERRDRVRRVQRLRERRRWLDAQPPRRWET